MVVQRDEDLKVWGWGTPGEKVTVKFIGKIYSAVIKNDSTWEVKMNPAPAGGPYTMDIAGKKKIEFNNIMVGDVYLCSGQSNMNMPLAGWGRVNSYLEEIARADNPQIRLLTIPLNIAHSPENDVETKGWKVCSPETVSDFSAVAYFFAREVQKFVDVPIGLVHSSKGGSPIEAWMNKAALKEYPEFDEEIQLAEESSKEEDIEIAGKYKSDLKSWFKKLNEKDYSEVQNILLGDSSSIKVSLPTVGEKHGLEEFNGILWFVRDVNLDKNWLKKGIELHLGTTDDFDAAFINGVFIGENQTKSAPSIYSIPDHLLLDGKNQIAVRVLDVSGRGGFFGNASDIYLKNGKNSVINIAKNWKLFQGIKLDEITPELPKRPYLYKRATVLFNGMINPVKDLGYKAVLWYQGESNSSRAEQYKRLFPDLINFWRSELNNSELPFYYVQLTSYYLTYNPGMDNGWCELREAQAEVLDMPNTGMAVTIDIGSEFDVHPKNKQEVGRRLALIALDDLYDVDIASRSPLLKNFSMLDGKVTVEFDYVYDGLKTSDGMEPSGFYIAGPDSLFYPAEAEIDKDKIILYNNSVTEPVALRYAWSSYPKCNLINSEGLPAAPFRTDNWKFNSTK
jgi:sialate O-acetylesterase